MSVATRDEGGANIIWQMDGLRIRLALFDGLESDDRGGEDEWWCEVSGGWGLFPACIWAPSSPRQMFCMSNDAAVMSEQGHVATR